MMKIKYKLIAKSICLLLLATACNSNLEEEVFSQSSPNAYFTSKGDVKSALNGMYDPLLVCCGGYEQGRSFVLNTVSDEGSMSAGNWGALDNLTYSQTSNNDIGNMWNSNYKSINAANFVLENAAKIKALDNASDQSFSKAALGEASFMRGHTYFDLVRVFGGVPLRTSVAKTTAELDLPRNSVEDVYTQIITDLEFAANNLPPVATEIGRPTSWAAKAYLAKVYLTMGNFPLALTTARDVVTMGPYQIIKPFASVFDVNNENNAEVIFDLQYIRTNLEGSRISQLATGNNTQFAAFGRGGWGLQYAEAGFFEKYSANDDRRATTFASVTPHPTNGRYYFGKWRDPQGVSVDGHENNFIAYRFADIVLILAEAANEVATSPTMEAYDAINSIRDRALLPDLPVGLSKDAFRDAVLYERHLELAFEQHRWFDLKRTGRLEQVLTAIGKTWNPRYQLFPIYQDEIDASNNILLQDPLYN